MKAQKEDLDGSWDVDVRDQDGELRYVVGVRTYSDALYQARMAESAGDVATIKYAPTGEVA